MLSIVPAPVHRFALYVAHRLRLVWWAWRKPEIHGCNAIMVNAAGEVLLVRHSYQAPGHWMLPGGGMGRGETAETAAARELKEEVGCRLVDARCFGIDIVDLCGARNHVHLVEGRSEDLPVPDLREIIAAQFHRPDALPPMTARSARARIERWRDQTAPDSGGQLRSVPD